MHSRLFLLSKRHTITQYVLVDG